MMILLISLRPPGGRALLMFLHGYADGAAAAAAR